MLCCACLLCWGKVSSCKSPPRHSTPPLPVSCAMLCFADLRSAVSTPPGSGAWLPAACGRQGKRHQLCTGTNDVRGMRCTYRFIQAVWLDHTTVSSIPAMPHGRSCLLTACCGKYLSVSFLTCTVARSDLSVLYPTSSSRSLY